MAMISPFKFLQEVRAEAQKVTWPSRRETAITTAMVFVMVAIASVFFLVADQVMRMFVTLILGDAGYMRAANDVQAFIYAPRRFQLQTPGRRFHSRAAPPPAPRSPVRRGHGAGRKG